MKRLDAVTIVAAIGIFLWACFLVFSAKAEPVCFPNREVMEALLLSRFGEVPDKIGIANDNMIALYVAPSGSWTLALHRPNGQVCVVAGGDSWTDAPKQPGEAM